jgi:hypothetical protein
MTVLVLGLAWLGFSCGFMALAGLGFNCGLGMALAMAELLWFGTMSSGSRMVNVCCLKSLLGETQQTLLCCFSALLKHAYALT